MRRAVFAGVLVLSAVVVSAQSKPSTSDPLVGTWKLNVAKSTWSPGPGVKSDTSVWEALGNGEFKLTEDVVEATGQAVHRETIVRFDGTEIAFKGTQFTTMSSFTRTPDGGFRRVNKVNGKPTTTANWVMSADGKTRTGTATGVNAQGQTVKNVTVYEKQ